MHEEGGRNSRWAEDKEGKRQNALKRIVDLKPSLVNDDTSLQQVAGLKKRHISEKSVLLSLWVYVSVLSSLSNKTAIKSSEYQ